MIFSSSNVKVSQELEVFHKLSMHERGDDWIVCFQFSFSYSLGVQLSVANHHVPATSRHKVIEFLNQMRRERSSLYEGVRSSSFIPNALRQKLLLGRDCVLRSEFVLGSVLLYFHSARICLLRRHFREPLSSSHDSMLLHVIIYFSHLWIIDIVFNETDRLILSPRNKVKFGTKGARPSCFCCSSSLLRNSPRCGYHWEWWWRMFQMVSRRAPEIRAGNSRRGSGMLRRPRTSIEALSV